MSLSPQSIRALLIASAAMATIVVGAFSFGWYALRLELRRSVESKCLYLTADGFKGFVEEHGRWPESQEELLDSMGLTASGRRTTLSDMEPLIISYDCDLARENLDSPETFRCLRPKDPSALSGIGEDGIQSLLETLRDVRDGRWTPPAPRIPAGQAVPADAEEAADRGGRMRQERSTKSDADSERRGE